MGLPLPTILIYGQWSGQALGLAVKGGFSVYLASFIIAPRVCMGAMKSN